MGVFWSGARAGGNNTFTRGDSVPSGLLKKRDEVLHLVDSTLMGKTKTDHPQLSRANTGSSLANNVGILVLAFPHLKPIAASSLGNVFEVRPSHTSNRPPPGHGGEG